jgi:16S rRNA (guanine527-N7)-methyltransferase
VNVSRETMPEVLTPTAFAELVDVSRETLIRLEVYAEMLRDWQTRMNLVSNSSLDDLWRRHFLDSAQLFRLLSPEPTPLFDLGSGAGFPGLVLAIMGVPDVTLIESSTKKCSFLREVAKETGTKVTIFADRTEQFYGPYPARTIVARALAPLEKLIPLAQPLLARGGEYLFMKGAKADEELTVASKKWHIEVERIRSLSDDQATILRITQLKPIKSATGKGN